MSSRTRRLLSVPLCTVLIAGAIPAIHAAELGDPRVSSHIGQQLVADIELTLLEDAGTPVQARLASPEVYSEAGIAVPAALSSLNLSVMRRDGRQFLHATTLRPVDADHLHLYLELTDHGQRVVRLATLWLTPDPNPAPVALPVPVPVPSAAALPAPTPAPAHAQVAPKIAAAAPVPKPMPPAPVPKPAPLLPVAQPAQLPLHTALQTPARPAACAPQSGEAQACVVLGARNAELRARIGQLEQRVKGLQASLGAGQGKPAGRGAAALPAPALAAAGREAPTPVPQQPVVRAPEPKSAAHKAVMRAPEPTFAPQKPVVMAPEPKPAPAPAGPAPIASIKPLVPHKPKTPPPEADPPWSMIGGALAVLAALAALGGAAALVRARRKRSPKAAIPAAPDAPGVLPRLRERFFTGNGGKAPADPASKLAAEPTLK
jgi:hypothetical protein